MKAKPKSIERNYRLVIAKNGYWLETSTEHVVFEDREKLLKYLTDTIPGTLEQEKFIKALEVPKYHKGTCQDCGDKSSYLNNDNRCRTCAKELEDYIEEESKYDEHGNRREVDEEEENAKPNIK